MPTAITDGPVGTPDVVRRPRRALILIALVAMVLLASGSILGIRAVQARNATCDKARGTPIYLGSGLSDEGHQRHVRDTVILLNAGCFSDEEVKAAVADLVPAN